MKIRHHSGPGLVPFRYLKAVCLTPDGTKDIRQEGSGSADDIRKAVNQYRLCIRYEKKGTEYMEEQKNMTSEEKVLLQAKHRQEEAEARNRVRERKVRTRRLIEKGAVLESVAPWCIDMTPEQVKMELQRRLGTP